MSEITHLETENAKLQEQGARLFDKTLELGTENAKLQDENARLRSCLSDDAENARMIMDENAKLRELVRDMWHEGAFAPGACYVETDRLEERTRELGVEVDG